MKNLYLPILKSEVQQFWFRAVVGNSVDECRHSLDGTMVLLRLPAIIQRQSDVPAEWLPLYKKYKSKLLTHHETLKLCNTPAWAANDTI